ncbi:MAG TPA: hypothetical protein VMS96_03845 [Terriglobales bacterium]|nr:hypothetical protein [Terriglobales bacterium]
MFEDEIKMEEKSSNVMPLLMALGLIVAIVGGIGYFILESKRTLTQKEATQVVSDLLKVQGPAKVHFHAGGRVEPSMDEKPFDPHYRLLEKVGVVTLGKPTYKGLEVKITPEGLEELKQCGATADKNADGTDAYTVPLAKRKLVEVSKVEITRPGMAKVEYTWNWEPTRLGQDFDANSKAMASLSVWDRTLLIQKYGADFYKDSEPKKVAITLSWDSKTNSWKPFTEY